MSLAKERSAYPSIFSSNNIIPPSDGLVPYNVDK